MFLKLVGYIIDNWSRDCEVYKENLSSGFFNNAKFVGMDQITSKNCDKSSGMQVIIKFFLLAIAQSNSPLFLYAVYNGIKPLGDEAAFPILIIFVKY